MAVVLIAEDDDDVRPVLERIFTRAGFTVLTAADGVTALRQTLQNRPDVVLTDLDMPGMNGLDLCTAIRQNENLQDIPVAVLSGGLRPDDPRIAGSRLCGVLLKPFSRAELVAAVQRLADVGPHPHPHTTTAPCFADG